MALDTRANVCGNKARLLAFYVWIFEITPVLLVCSNYFLELFVIDK